MESLDSVTLISVTGGGTTGRLHAMRGVSTTTLCGRNTDNAMVHDGEWVDEILNGDLSKATSVCARCRASLAKTPSP